MEATLAALDEESRRRPRRTAHGRSLRAHLALALGLAGDPRAEPTMLQLLSAEDVEERVAAARALGKLGTLQSSHALQVALQDPEWAVRAQAAKALGRLGAVSTIPALEFGLGDSAWWVRSNCATALRLLGAPGLEALTRALQSEDRYTRDRAREALDLAAVGNEGSR